VIVNRIALARAVKFVVQAADRVVGRLAGDDPLADFAAKPALLGLELTNLCNADCIFCPYQFQTRPIRTMSEAIFAKAVADFVVVGGGDVDLTPVVGDALIDPDFLPRVRRLRAEPAIGHINLITNGILLDKHGIGAVLESGISAIGISTAGFEAEMYRRVYRNSSYQRMRGNVLALVQENARRGRPVEVSIYLRPDRPLDDVFKDPDFAEILSYRPQVGAQRIYSDAGGRIAPESLPRIMKLRVLEPRNGPCAQTFWGPIVLSDGTVLVCNCFASMDARDTLGLGNILEKSLIEMWRGEQLRSLRASFGTDQLNATCARCTAYHPPASLYRMSERKRARRNRERYEASSQRTLSKT
jgi:radical SAM protein with 4Fe4S-binding SPASM domain